MGSAPYTPQEYTKAKNNEKLPKHFARPHQAPNNAASSAESISQLT